MNAHATAPAPSPPRPLRGFEHIGFYWDRRYGRFAAKLNPGEYYVTTEDHLIMTVLGSCVSACVRDTVLGVGGMNHFMLPANDDPASLARHVARSASAANRYGTYAMENMINDILKHGGSRDRLEVKIFGGGKILSSMADIGGKNIAFVREFLQIEGFRVSAEDVGDRFPRKLYYEPHSGRVQVKRLKQVESEVVKREENYRRTIDRKPVGGAVELF
ncbi:MAG TPA: chemoreceptor glutamine deamidase CheD [Candidatus Krumholzibacteria bacterium]|nr:chemoreceptor glutamine deamidase CheD [Candidatus Krumholzibacteria bacterium]